MLKIKVDCYSGYRSDERPRYFIFNNKHLIVKKINKQWRTPDYEYFEVLADDKSIYLLKHDMKRDEWNLEWFKNE